jgi:hypothetical protein
VRGCILHKVLLAAVRVSLGGRVHRRGFGVRIQVAGLILGIVFIEVFWDGVRVRGVARGEGAHWVGGGGGGVVRGGAGGFGRHFERVGWWVGGRESERVDRVVLWC